MTKGAFHGSSNFVVLPLYSVRNHSVPEKSGINQWNAGGRTRNFGEAYIPVPKIVHTLRPDFFPERGVEFLITLPGSKYPYPAKLCQSDSKALMTSPNDALCEWLYRAIDPTFSVTWLKRSPARPPYSYQDLINVGSDSVTITKSVDQLARFQLELSAIGTFERWIAGFSS